MFNKISVLFLITFFSLSAFAGPMLEITSEEGLNSYITKSKFNGVILVAKDKNILLKKAFGYKNFETKTPLTTSDRFQIGSNTKQFVAASIVKLEEEGLLSLKDSITKYFPELTQYKNITIREILNHTSGISNYTDHPEFWQAFENKESTLDDIIKFNYQFPLEFEAKTNWNYSNTGYVVAGRIVELVSGQTWNQYIENNFLKPLSMDNSGYEKNFEKVSDVVGYVLENNKLEPITGFSLTWALSAGALYSTVDDLLKWTSIYDSSSLLSEKSKEEMQTPFLNQYALGVFAIKYPNDTLINHGGTTPGFSSTLDYLKVSKLAVVALSNINSNVPSISGLIKNFYFEGKATAIKLDPYSVSSEVLKDYEGVYSLGEKSEFNIFIKDEKLFLQPNDGQPAYLLIANDKDSFFFDGMGEEFLRDEAGRVVELKHYQNGRIFTFKKKN